MTLKYQEQVAKNCETLDRQKKMEYAIKELEMKIMQSEKEMGIFK